MNKVTLKIAPRKDRVKPDGTSALCLSITIDRKTRKYSLGICVDYSKWDFKSSRLKAISPNAFQVNKFITDELAKATNKVVEIRNTENFIDFEMFEAAYFNKGVNKEDFYAFMREYATINKGKLSEGYLRQFIGEISKLKKFKPTLNFNEINYDFLQKYEYYMRNTLNNKTNTVHKTLKKIKTVVKAAMIKNPKLYDRNPFDNYKLRTEATLRQFLSTDELNLMYEQKDNFDDRVSNVVNYFLFSCYTGLRYDDVSNLRYSQISDDTIRLKMGKTSEVVMIPLISKAKILIPQKQKSDNVFRTISNTKTNDYLYIATKAIGIDKKITFHCARHTFATIALNAGIPLEVVQKLLGHSLIRTTQIYAKLADSTIKAQMQKLEGI